MRSSRHFVLAVLLLATACSPPKIGKKTMPADGSAEDQPGDVSGTADAVDVSLATDADSASDLEADDDPLPDALDTAADNAQSGDLVLDGLPVSDAAPSDLTTDTDPADEDQGYVKPGKDAQQPDIDVVIYPPDAPVLEGCKDVRKKHDNKVFWDNCWEPPLHYCSMEDDAASMWSGCKPGSMVCCTFPSSCIPCGWIHCSPVAPLSSEQLKKCWGTQNLPVVPGECLPYLSNYEPICWDGIDPSWNDKAHHWMIDNAAWLSWQ